MKKLYIILMLAITGIMAEAQTSVWDGSRKLWTRGEGTESNPYQIESAENLAFLAYMVNEGYETRDLYFELTTDIDLNGSEDQPWMPIGLDNNYFYEDGCQRVPYTTPNTNFRGHFDGDGHKIYNIYIQDVSVAGLFGLADAQSIIENVSVESGFIQNATYGGGIVGKGGAGVIISNCSNGADISGNYVGGIVGNGCGLVSQCFNSGNIKSNNAGGGISGILTNEIIECFNIGNVTTHSGSCGGIIGSNQRQVTIMNCYNMGRIYGTASNIGGIGGFLIKGLVKNCYNAGEISNSQGTVGGIIGSDFNGTIDNVYYLNTCGGEGIGTAMSDIEMREEAFVAVLNNDTNVWSFDKDNVNDGYPVLECFHLSTSETPGTTMSVYPNPAKDSFTVEGTGLLTVTNTLGQKVMEKAIENRIIVTLPEGLYLLKLTDGNTSATQKVVVY